MDEIVVEEPLSSGWNVLVDGNCSSSLPSMRYKMVKFGEFNTILGFWQVWNSFGGELNLLDRLPGTINVRLFQSNVEASNPQDPHLRFGGKWMIECASEDISRAFFMLMIATVSDNMTDNVVGVVLNKHQGAYKVSVWTRVFDGNDEVSFRMTLGAMLEDVVFIPNNPQLKADPPVFNAQPRKKLRMKVVKSFANADACHEIPPQYEHFDWSSIYQAPQQNTSNNSRSLASDVEKARMKLSTEFGPYFDHEIVPRLNKPRQELLNAEGCVLCAKTTASEYSGPFIILRCKLLHCQHVVYLDELRENSVHLLKKYHCTSFFDVYSVNRDDPSMNPIPCEPLGKKKSCMLRIQLCHLLNDTHILDLHLGGQAKNLSSLQDTRTGTEFLLVSLPDPANQELVENAKLAGNYYGPNFFEILRARFVITVKDGTTGYVHDANFDLTSGKPNATCFKLNFDDQQSGNSVTIGLKRAIIDNRSVTVIKFVRYDFASRKTQSQAPPNMYVDIPQHPPMTMSPTVQSREFSHYNDGITQSSDTPARSQARNTREQSRANVDAHFDSDMGGIPPHRLVCRTPPPSTGMYSPHSPGASYNDPYHGSSPHGPRGQFPPHMVRGDNYAPPHHGHGHRGRMDMDRRVPPYMDKRHMHVDHADERPQRMGRNGPYSPNRMARDPYDPAPHHMYMSHNQQHNMGRRRRKQRYGHQDNYMGKDSAFNLSSTEEDESTISHLIGRVVYLAKSESGSRFVQEKVGNPRFLKIFFQEMKKRLPELMTDNFGHYAVETLFNHCSSNQRVTLLQNLGPSLPNVACHKQGSFSMQSLINAIATTEEILLLKDYLQRELHRIILSCPGHYVILRFISRFGWPVSDFVSDMLATNVVGFATDHYGLRVMKATFDSAGPGPKLDHLFQSVVEHTNSLAENQYGNYIIQHLFDIGSKQITDEVKQKMLGRYVRYSKQKFSSNVVEKCLKHSSSESHFNGGKKWSQLIVKELLGSAKELISDKYGNYCLQTALSTIHADPPLIEEFINHVEPHLDGLRVNVRNKWVKLMTVSRGFDHRFREVANVSKQTLV